MNPYSIWKTPLQLGRHLAKNRIVYPPISTNWSTTMGDPTSSTIEYYANQACGGSSLIIVEGTSVFPTARGSSNALSLYRSSNLSRYSAIAHEISRQGALPYIQLMHAGSQADGSKPYLFPSSPSGLPCSSIPSSPHLLSLIEIEYIISAFIDSAELAFYCGFKGIELHLSHGYLLHEFLSARTNTRSDIYGGSTLAQRFRIIEAIYNGISAKCPELDIGVRVSGDDFINNGLSQVDCQSLINCLEPLSPSYIHVTAGVYDSSDVKHQLMKKGSSSNYLLILRPSQIYQLLSWKGVIN